MQLITETMEKPSKTIVDGSYTIYVKTFDSHIGTDQNKNPTPNLKVVQKNGCIITAFPI